VLRNDNSCYDFDNSDAHWGFSHNAQLNSRTCLSLIKSVKYDDPRRTKDTIVYILHA